MGVQELVNEFNLSMGSAGAAVAAYLEYERAGGTEWQVLYFSGNYADGSGFSIKSNRIRPNGDVMAMVRATAAQVLAQKG